MKSEKKALFRFPSHYLLFILRTKIKFSLGAVATNTKLFHCILTLAWGIFHFDRRDARPKRASQTVHKQQQLTTAQEAITSINDNNKNVCWVRQSRGYIFLKSPRSEVSRLRCPGTANIISIDACVYRFDYRTISEGQTYGKQSKPRRKEKKEFCTHYKP